MSEHRGINNKVPWRCSGPSLGLRTPVLCLPACDTPVLHLLTLLLVSSERQCHLGGPRK